MTLTPKQKKILWGVGIALAVIIAAVGGYFIYRHICESKWKKFILDNCDKLKKDKSAWNAAFKKMSYAELKNAYTWVQQQSSGKKPDDATLKKMTDFETKYPGTLEV